MSAAQSIAPAPGFADATSESQKVYRALLDALAHPGRMYPIAGLPHAPAALGAGVAAVALTLFDDDVTVWMHNELVAASDVTSYLAFHTAARRTDSVATADFILATPATLPPLGALAPGTDEAPHQSATILLDARTDGVGASFSASGPGIDGWIAIYAPWASAGFRDEWHRNGSLFPRGVDVLIITDDQVCALPRTTRLRDAAPTTNTER